MGRSIRIQLPTALHSCVVSSEVCCPGAKPRKRARPLVTRFGVTLRVLHNEDLILDLYMCDEIGVCMIRSSIKTQYF